jgi:beta-N-acetylhexosaminidase
MQTTLELSELDSKIGRLFMAGIPGTVVDSETDALLRDFSLGGVILFKRNIEDPVQLAGLCRDLQERAMKYRGIPLFLAVDQEGGRVARLQEPFTLFPGNSAIGESDDPVNAARHFASVTAKEMLLVGLNMDMAPVVDVRRGEPEKHLSGRMFSQDPEKVALLGAEVIDTLQKRGVMAVAKHFPGLGNAPLDPHKLLPVIKSERHEIENIDLPPFIRAIKKGVSSIMTSHALYPALDRENPGTLSKEILSGLLRETLGFEGLIITDDMDMGAIGANSTVPEAAVRSFGAGADILLICNEQKGVTESIKRIRSALLSGEVPFRRLHESVSRIMDAKAGFLKILKKYKPVSLAKVRNYFKLA